MSRRSGALILLLAILAGLAWAALQKRHAEHRLPRECLSTLAEAEVHAACALIATHRRMRGG